MNNNQYMKKILALCTEEQKDIFNKMYGDGPTTKQIEWATKQIEKTLLDTNRRAQIAQNKLEESKLELFEIKGKFNILQRNNDDMTVNLKEAQYYIKLLSTHENKQRADIEKRLEKLDKLEAAGVDNWEWYEDAMKNYEC
jgi:hypothetical protein